MSWESILSVPMKIWTFPSPWPISCKFMKMPESDLTSLHDALAHATDLGNRHFWGANDSAVLKNLKVGTAMGGRLAELSGRSVLIRTKNQFAAALALIELDGVARRLLLCPPDVKPDHLPTLVANAEID